MTQAVVQEISIGLIQMWLIPVGIMLLLVITRRLMY
jgi:hypothetical protein